MVCLSPGAKTEPARSFSLCEDKNEMRTVNPRSFDTFSVGSPLPPRETINQWGPLKKWGAQTVRVCKDNEVSVIPYVA